MCVCLDYYYHYVIIIIIIIIIIIVHLLVLLNMPFWLKSEDFRVKLYLSHENYLKHIYLLLSCKKKSRMKFLSILFWVFILNVESFERIQKYLIVPQDRKRGVGSIVVIRVFQL